MTTAYWCIMIAGLLPYAATVIAKAGKRFDNNNPREWLAQQEGWRKRANAAQQNGFEGFPLFAAAVIVAHMTHAAQGRVDMLAMGYVAARLVYLGCYLGDIAPVRSLAFLAGTGCSIALFLQGA